MVNIGVSDFVPDIGDQVEQLTSFDDPFGSAVNAVTVIGWWAAVIILGVTVLSAGADLVNASIPVLDTVYNLEITVPGIGDVLVLPYLTTTGLFAFPVLLFAAGMERISAKLAEDDAKTAVLYFAVAQVILLIRGPGMVPFARASLWTVVVIGVVTWLVAAAMSRR